MSASTKSLKRIYTKITCEGKQLTGSIVYLTSNEVHITTRYSIQPETMVQLEFVPLHGRIVQLNGRVKPSQKIVSQNPLGTQTFGVNVFEIKYTCKKSSDLLIIKRYLVGKNEKVNNSSSSSKAKTDKPANTKEQNKANSEKEKLLELKQRIAELERQKEILKYENVARHKAESSLRSFYNLSYALSSVSQMDEALDIILESALCMDGIDACGICLVDQENGEVKLQRYKNLTDELCNIMIDAKPDSFHAKLILAGKPIYDLKSILVSQGNIEKDILKDIKSCALIPISNNNKIIAAIGIWSRSINEISVELRNNIEATATHVGGVIARLQAEKELGLFKALIESSSEAIAVCYPDGKSKYANPAYKNLFGRSREGMKRNNLYDYFPVEAVEIVDQDIMPILAFGKSWEGTLDILNANNKQIPVYLNCDSICNVDGKMQFAFAIFDDLSEERLKV